MPEFAHRAERLQSLFAPRSIAIIGASADLRKAPAGRLLHYLLRHEYAGEIFAINPKYGEVHGMRCYRGLEELPEVPELALVCVAAEQVQGVLRTVVASGVKGAMVFAGGFGETGSAGRRLQTQMRGLCQRNPDFVLLGPNCQGLANFGSHFVANFSAAIEFGSGRPGPLAIVSQSGAVAGRIFREATTRGLDCSYVVSTGNELDVDVADCISYISRDPDISVIGCYIEGARHGQRLLHALYDARARGKQILVVKPGSSSGAVRAIHSHTDSLAGTDEIFDAAFDATGVMRVFSLSEMLTSLDALRHLDRRIPAPRRPRILILTPSGGGGAILADACARQGFDVPPLDARLRSRIRGLLPPYASANNPVDFSNAWVAEPEVLTRLVEVGHSCNELDGILLFLGQGTASSPAQHERALKAVIQASNTCRDKPLIVGLPFDSGDSAERLRAQGVSVFRSEIECTTALWTLARPLATRRSQPPKRRSVDVAWLSANTSQGLLDPVDTAKLLRSGGIDIEDSILVPSVSRAKEVAARVGYPVILKAEFTEFVHRTELGGVSQPLRDPSDLSTTYSRLLEKLVDDRRFAGLTLQKVRRGVEVLMGSKADPAFGPVVVVAAGGQLVELLRETAVLIPPFSAADVRRKLSETRLRDLLAGYRGAQKADASALYRMTSRLGDLALAVHPHVETIDLNPVIVGPDHATAVDAKVRRSRHAERRDRS